MVFDKEMAKRVAEVIHSDRLVLVKVQAELVDLVLVQVYMPSSEHPEVDSDDLYE